MSSYVDNMELCTLQRHVSVHDQYDVGTCMFLKHRETAWELTAYGQYTSFVACSVANKRSFVVRTN